MTGTDKHSRAANVVVPNEEPRHGRESSCVVKGRGTTAGTPDTGFTLKKHSTRFIVDGFRAWEPTIVVVCVHDHSLADLAEVAQAQGASAFFTGLIQSRQEHRGENADDGDDDQELDQGEGGASCRSST
jgi:hypothetical protein